MFARRLVALGLTLLLGIAAISMLLFTVTSLLASHLSRDHTLAGALLACSDPDLRLPMAGILNLMDSLKLADEPALPSSTKTHTTPNNQAHDAVQRPAYRTALFTGFVRGTAAAADQQSLIKPCLDRQQLNPDPPVSALVLRL